MSVKHGKIPMMSTMDQPITFLNFSNIDTRASTFYSNKIVAIIIDKVLLGPKKAY